MASCQHNVCEQCKQYLNAIDLRQAKEEVMISLERLFTLDIDAQAQQYGYGCGEKRGTKVKRDEGSEGQHTRGGVR